MIWVMILFLPWKGLKILFSITENVYITLYCMNSLYSYTDCNGLFNVGHKQHFVGSYWSNCRFDLETTLSETITIIYLCCPFIWDLRNGSPRVCTTSIRYIQSLQILLIIKDAFHKSTLWQLFSLLMCYKYKWSLKSLSIYASKKKKSFAINQLAKVLWRE